MAILHVRLYVVCEELLTKSRIYLRFYNTNVKPQTFFYRSVRGFASDVYLYKVFATGHIWCFNDVESVCE